MSALRDQMSSRKLQLLNVPFQYPYEGGQFYYERTCYDEYFKLVERLLASGRECVTVTGTPGIGKSVFYAYFADRYLKAHSDTWIIAAAFINGVMTKAMLLGDQPSTMYPSAGDDLEAFVSAAAGRAQREGEKLILLCDGPPRAFGEYGQSVVFPSPDESWLKTVEKLRCTYYMPLWTPEELHAAAHVLGHGRAGDLLGSVHAPVLRRCHRRLSGRDRMDWISSPAVSFVPGR